MHTLPARKGCAGTPPWGEKGTYCVAKYLILRRAVSVSINVELKARYRVPTAYENMVKGDVYFSLKRKNSEPCIIYYRQYILYSSTLQVWAPMSKLDVVRDLSLNGVRLPTGQNEPNEPNGFYRTKRFSDCPTHTTCLATPSRLSLRRP